MYKILKLEGHRLYAMAFKMALFMFKRRFREAYYESGLGGVQLYVL